MTYAVVRDALIYISLIISDHCEGDRDNCSCTDALPTLEQAAWLTFSIHSTYCYLSCGRKRLEHILQRGNVRRTISFRYPAYSDGATRPCVLKSGKTMMPAGSLFHHSEELSILVANLPARAESLSQAIPDYLSILVAGHSLRICSPVAREPRHLVCSACPR